MQIKQKSSIMEDGSSAAITLQNAIKTYQTGIRKQPLRVLIIVAFCVYAAHRPVRRKPITRADFVLPVA